MARESLGQSSVFWPWAIAGVHMAKGPVKAGWQEVGLERGEVQGLWQMPGALRESDSCEAGVTVLKYLGVERVRGLASGRNGEK